MLITANNLWKKAAAAWAAWVDPYDYEIDRRSFIEGFEQGYAAGHAAGRQEANVAMKESNASNR